MSAVFKTYFNTKLCTGYMSGDHAMYVMNSEDIITLAAEGNLKLWSRNRPADELRVAEIREIIKKTEHVDGTIRVAFIKDEGLVCYEGNHRRMALIPGVLVIVDILWDVDQDRVVEEFVHVNRAVSVPDLYTSVDMDATAKLKIVQYVSKLEAKYPKFKTGNKPNRPNFNRDGLISDITKIWESIGCSVDTLTAAITALNEKYTAKDPEFVNMARKKPSESIMKKCEDADFWLFAFDTSLNKTHIEKLLLSD